MNHATNWLQMGCLALTAAGCSGATLGDDAAPKNAVADLLYVGACTPSDCDDSAVPELACAQGSGEYVCSASNGGECTVRLECPAGGGDPDTTTSFAPCASAQCGPTPNEPAADCPAGTSWSAPQCGSLNGVACAWGNHCAKDAPPSSIDESKLGKACDASSGPCAGTEECVTLPGIEGAHCVQDPCGLLACPAGKCIQRESYPGQVQCMK